MVLVFQPKNLIENACLTNKTIKKHQNIDPALDFMGTVGQRVFAVMGHRNDVVVKMNPNFRGRTTCQLSK